MKGDRIAFKKRPQYKKKKRPAGAPQVIERVRLPNKEEGEILGLVEERLPATKLRVMCVDGKLRLVRIPGKLKRRTFVRPGDVIILKPWELDDDKADLVWRYFRPQAEFLQRKGYLKGIF